MKERSKASRYKCNQLFGYKGSNEKIHEEDIISTLKFDLTGNYLGLGDKAGRVIIFKAGSDHSKQDRLSYFTQFQAFKREFDLLNSGDINEEIIQLRWLNPQGHYQKMLTMNGKTIKQWKIYEKEDKKIAKISNRQLVLPKLQKVQTSIDAFLQQTFPSKHEEDLVGLDVSNNEEYIICSDTVKTMLWNSEKSGTPYLIADLQKSMKIEDVQQNINCLKMHPFNDSLFAYGTNKGSLFLSDMRISNSYTPLAFKLQQKGNFLNEMISSYSSLCFINNSKYIAARDFLTVKVWDVSCTDKPILDLNVQELSKSRLCEVLQNECIFDKFSLSASKDSNTLLTGDYNNSFHAIDVCDSSKTQYQLSYKKKTIIKPLVTVKYATNSKMDYIRKTLVSDFNPKTNLFSVASLNCFFIYSM